MKSLKDQISKTGKGGTIEIPYGGEFLEDIVIDKSITIRSNFSVAAIIGKSPTVSIKKNDVTLENLHIECNEADGICLSIKKGINVNFNNVFVKGKIDGLEGENGEWDFPHILELPIEANKSHNFKIIIHSPVNAKIYPADISCVKCNPVELVSGPNELEICVDELFENTIVSGDLIIETKKHKLKRKIALNGNTFQTQQPKANKIGEYLWICKSLQNDIDESVISKLPDGNQWTRYEMILDQTLLKLDTYELRIDGLPNGLSFINSSPPYKIEGIPCVYGKFELVFIFSKDNKEYRYSSTLKIVEKLISPLKIKPLPDIIKAVEDELISIKFEILSSSSLNINYKVENGLPSDLQLYGSTGEIRGKITKHGIYEIVVKINDGVNELSQDIKFYINPKYPLELSIKRTYQFYKNDYFEIPLNIRDEERLNPSIKLKDNYSDALKIESKENSSFLIGQFFQTNEYPVEMIINDIYGRSINQNILIKCVEKLYHTVNTPDPHQPPNGSTIKSPSGIKHQDGSLLSDIFNHKAEPSITTDISDINQNTETSNNVARSRKKSVTISPIFSPQINRNANADEKESEKCLQSINPFVNSTTYQQTSDADGINKKSESTMVYKQEVKITEDNKQNDDNSKKKRVLAKDLSPLFRNNQ